MSHDRGCPCGKENGDVGYRECSMCLPLPLTTPTVVQKEKVKVEKMKLFIVWSYDDYTEPKVFTDVEEVLDVITQDAGLRVLKYEIGGGV